MKDINALSYLMNTEFEDLFKRLIKFRELLPAVVTVVGIKTFLAEMGMSKDQYYRRTSNPALWTIEELELAARILARYKQELKKGG